MDVPAQGPSRPDLPVRQRRRERAGHVQQPHPDGGRSAPGARRHHPQLLRHPGDDGLRLPALRVPAVPDAACRRPSTSATPPATWARTSSAATSRSTSIMHRGAAAYICGEETGLIESLEGKRAWPRIKPPFPAVEGLFRKPTVVNNIETLACVTHIVDRGVDWFKSIGVPPDPKNPRDPGSYGPKLYCLSGHVNKPGCYEAPLGITVPRVDRRVRRRRVEGPQGEGRDSRRHQHGPDDRGRVRHAAGFHRPGQGRLPGPGHGGRHGARRNRSRWSTSCTTVAGSSPTRAAASARPAARAPRWVAEDARADQGRPGPAEGSAICCWKSATRSASCPARRSAAWPTAPPGRSRTRSASSAASSKSTSSGRIPSGYMETEPVPALPVAGALIKADDVDHATQATADTRMHLSSESYGQLSSSTDSEIEIGRRRAAQRHPGRRAGRHRDSALLLAPGLDGRGQLPHVPGRDRHAQRRRPAQITMSPSSCPACQTPATDGTVFVTNSEKVAQSRAMVEEDLLLEHPIDCPICDKAGECYLQDYHFEYGQDERRADVRPFTSRRRDMGDTVTLFVDRCVMCSRCVRFTPRDQRHQRADGHQPRQPRGDRRLARLSAGTTSCRATWSISARSGPWATRTFSTSSGSGS